MQTTQGVRFDSYHLAGPQGPLVQESHIVNIPPKALAVLWVLITRAGQVVTKEELLTTVWANTIVSEDTLTAFIGILRRALQDDARHPRYIATVHRIGYRFIAPLTTPLHQGSGTELQNEVGELPDHTTFLPISDPQSSPPILVGREAELLRLHRLFSKVLNGERQIVFVTGEAGIGKTSLIDAFLEGLRGWELRSSSLPLQAPNPRSPIPNPEVWMAWGQCIEQYGAGEAYLPILEALGRLGRGPDKTRLLIVLHQYAPTWVAQLPALLSPAELEAVQRREQGTTRERMLREITEALEVLSAEHPLVLVLEDLHWSDPSTVELLAMLARRREAARLLVLGTYRPVDLVVTHHPLKTVKQELVARGQGTEVLLGGLSRDAVRTYVTRRLGPVAMQDELTEFIHKRTEGQPLFMVQVTDYLVQHDRGTAQSVADITAVEQTLPHGLRELIEAQLGRLSEDEQSVLLVGSVTGTEFTVASVATGTEKGEPVVEELCDRLARRGQFIEEHGAKTWPDGTVGGSYRFRHALYQEVLYQRLSASRRARLHRQIGEREEASYGARAHEIAAELAVHFERGQDYERAVRYRQYASEQALRRNAYQEAAMHCTAGLALLVRVSETPERLHYELRLQMTAGVIFAATKGYAAPEVEQAYLRAQALCEQHSDTSQMIQVLRGLMILYTVRANFPAAREVGERILTLAQEANDAALLQLAHMLLGVVWLWLGELAIASDHFSRGATFVDPPQTPGQHRDQALRNGQDHRVALLAHAAWMWWLLGYPAQAVRQGEEALHIAREIAHPFSEAFALLYEAGVQQFCRAVPRAQQRAAAALRVAEEQGFTFFATRAKSAEGWILAQQGRVAEGVAHMQQSLAVYKRLGIERGQPHFLADLAEAYAKGGQYEEGIATVTKALQLVASTGERWYEAELWRIKGEIALQQLRMKNVELKMQEAKDERQKRLSVIGSQALVPTPQPLTLSTQVGKEPEVEACFLKAVEIARQQQAKSLELRAVMSLVRLRQQQVRNHAAQSMQHEARRRLADAHLMLSEVYNWFTEGFDTKDLQEAKALIEELSD